MINLYKLGVIPEFQVHFNNDMTEIIFLTEYTNNKWEMQGTSIITYNMNIKKWKGCINTRTKDELCIKYPHLFEKNLFINNTIIIEEYVTFESYDIDDILEPSLNPFDARYLDVNYCYNLTQLYSINKTKIYNMFFAKYHVFLNNLIYKDNDLANCKDVYFRQYSYLTYNYFLQEYIY